MSPITVPTAPTDEAPYFLEFEYSSHSGHHVAISDARAQESVVADFSHRRDDSDDETPERVREEAWVVACALNAAHMAAPLDEFVAVNEAGELCWPGKNGYVFDRERAAALGLALIEFAATGRLPGEGS